MLEIVVVLVMISILAVVAVPEFSKFIEKNRLTTQANEFVAALNYARSEAVKRADRVTLCKSSNGTQCVTTGDWEQGWLIFPDADADGTVDAGETVLQVGEKLPGGNTLVGSADVKDTIVYLGTGFIDKKGELKVCDGPKGIKIDIGSTGRVQTGKTSCP